MRKFHEKLWHGDYQWYVYPERCHVKLFMGEQSLILDNEKLSYNSSVDSQSLPTLEDVISTLHLSHF